MDKIAAEELVSTSLGLPQDVDLTSFDPYENAAIGESQSTAVLVEGARVASLIKQTESFVNYLSGSSYLPGSATQSLIEALADKIKGSQSAEHPIDNLVGEVINQVIQEEIDVDLTNSEEVADFIQIVQVSDSLHKSLKNSNYSPAEVASQITKQQLAVKQEVIDELENVTTGTMTLKSLSEIISEESLRETADSFVTVNLFAPDAEDLAYTFTSLDHAQYEIIQTISGIDLDGDQINYAITSGNIDSNENGIDFLSVDSNGNLLLQDAEELEGLIAKKINLLITLSDNGGKTKNIHAEIKIENGLVLESQSTSADSWMNSDWLGSFHKTGGPWIFHQIFGWQYVYTLTNGGFWFWDREEGYWWWTDSNVFPMHLIILITAGFTMIHQGPA